MVCGEGKSRVSDGSGVGSAGSVLLPAGLVGHRHNPLGAFLLLVIGSQPCLGSSYFGRKGNKLVP